MYKTKSALSCTGMRGGVDAGYSNVCGMTIAVLQGNYVATLVTCVIRACRDWSGGDGCYSDHSCSHCRETFGDDPGGGEGGVNCGR